MCGSKNSGCHTVAAGKLWDFTPLKQLADLCKHTDCIQLIQYAYIVYFAIYASFCCTWWISLCYFQLRNRNWNFWHHAPLKYTKNTASDTLYKFPIVIIYMSVIRCLYHFIVNKQINMGYLSKKLDFVGFWCFSQGLSRFVCRVSTLDSDSFC